MLPHGRFVGSVGGLYAGQEGRERRRIQRAGNGVELRNPECVGVTVRQLREADQNPLLQALRRRSRDGGTRHCCSRAVKFFLALMRGKARGATEWGEELPVSPALRQGWRWRAFPVAVVSGGASTFELVKRRAVSYLLNYQKGGLVGPSRETVWTDPTTSFTN